MFDIGDKDFPVVTSGNWVGLIKFWVIKWPVKLYVRFLRFFQNPKKHVFLCFTARC